MFGLCRYKNIFGRPGKGIHRFRIANIAVVDVIFTFILAYILQVVFFEKYHYLSILLVCLLSAVIIHRMFCVKTPIDKFLFS